MRWISLAFLALLMVNELIEWKKGREEMLQRCAITKCRREARNPSQQVAVRWGWERLAPRQRSFPLMRAAFSNRLEKLFGKTPTVLAFERAVWLGEISDLPNGVSDLYRDLGLLGTLALSGQHVVSFVLVARILLFFIPACHRILPLLGAIVLFFSSGGAPSMMRTLAMTISFYILLKRRLFSAGLQILFSSSAFLIVSDPSLLRDVGFLLSFLGTLGLLVLLEEASLWGAFKCYLWTSLLLPVLFFPITAYFFGRVAIFAPFASLLLSWIWDLILIPAGFLLPLIAIIPRVNSILPLLNGLLEEFFAFQHAALAGKSLVLSTIRPSELELFVVISLGLCGALKIARK